MSGHCTWDVQDNPRSFAAGAGVDDINLVLWHWGTTRSLLVYIPCPDWFRARIWSAGTFSQLWIHGCS